MLLDVMLAEVMTYNANILQVDYSRRIDEDHVWNNLPEKCNETILFLSKITLIRSIIRIRRI